MHFNFFVFEDFSVERCSQISLFHGFYGKPYDFYKDELRDRLDVSVDENILVPNQVHGDGVIDLRSETWRPEREADAVIMSTEQVGVIGVKTADCLPILIQSKNLIAAVHAGWKGVANGITEKVLESFSEEDKVICVVGPHAQNYEVGGEVIDAMNGECIYKKLGDEKFELNLKETLRLKIKRFSNVSFHASSICTISSRDFHSFRREKDQRGSNLSIIMSR